MLNLPEPNFIDRVIEEITRYLVELYEGITGKTLYPAQVERVLIDVMAYRETLVRIGIQEAAKQNLLYYARTPMIDYLGELMGVVRLPAAAAQTQLEFTLAAARGADLVIPAGTLISAGTGLSQFATDEALTLAAGTTTGTVWASATTAGASGNLFAAGQINVLDTDLGAADLTAENISISSGGTDAEADDRLRERIRLAPEAYTTCGSVGAYRFHALSAHPSIIDVCVRSVLSGQVQIFPLCDTGLPDAGILALVAAACSGDTVRPLCDTVIVAAPTQVSYTVSAALTVYADVDAAAVLTAAQVALAAYTDAQALRLGRDITRSALIAAISVSGVQSVSLSSPIGDLSVAAPEWAVCGQASVSIAAISDESL